MRTVHFYGDIATRRGVPKKFLGTPFVVDEDGKIDIPISQYFLARRNGDYIPGEISGVSMELRGLRAAQCSPVYLRNRSYHLDLFRRWSRSKSISHVQADANHIEQFATDYESGKLTGSIGLKPSTTNQVLCSVIDFLSYCVVTGLRKKLGLPYKSFTVNYPSGSRPFSSRARHGTRVKHYIVSRRENPREIVEWSTFKEIQDFLDGFDRSEHRLGAEIIYATGLRLSEMLNLCIDTFPTESEWKANRKKRYIRVKGKRGKIRDVEIELAIVRKVHNFIQTQRPKNLRKWGRQSKYLLVGPSGRISQRMFQRAVKAVAKAVGQDYLCPHMIRHHYAAHFLLRAWDTRRDHTPYTAGLGTLLLGHELIRLQQNLGHSNLETTCGYLTALGYLAAPQLSDRLRAGLEARG